MTDDTEVGEDRTRTSEERLHAVGRFVVLDTLGTGGMGVVYAAYDPQLDRKIALKLLHPPAHVRAREDHVRGKLMQRLFGDVPPPEPPTPAPEADQTRLLREAQAAARINHPHVITIHDVGQHRGRVFIAMEYVHGSTLSKWLGAQRRSWREILRPLLDAGEGLSAAHDKGVVHRDFKPDNVMIGDDGRVRVMDFGLAHGQATEPITEEIRPDTDALARALTAAGAVMGTPAYMAPEQFQSRPTDARSDQFSFCVAAWEAFYGQRPFAGDSVASISLAVTEGRREPPPAEASVPAHIRRALDRGLATDPEARFGSMQELLAELRRDPTRVRRWTFLAGTALAVTAAGAGLWKLDHMQTLDRCEAEAHAIDDVWDDDARAGIDAAIRASGVAFAEATIERVHPWFDAYAAEWSTLRADACATAAFTTGHEADIATRTTECLDDRLGFLQSTLDAMAQPGPHVVRRAVLVAAELPALSDCTDEAALARRKPLPDDPDERAQMVELQRGFAETSALEASGDFEAALARAKALVDLARALDRPAMVARARYRLGALYERVGNYDAAVDELTAAALDSAALGEDADAVEASARLAVVVAERKSDYATGLVWAHWAEALVRRLGAEDDLLGATVHNHLGVVLQGSGAAKEALAHKQRSLEINERILGAEHPDVALALNNLGTVRSTMGDFDGAEQDYERALVIFEAVLGPEHPDTAMPLVNRAEMSWRRGRLDEARRHMERALAIQEAGLGPKHPTVGASIGNLGLLVAELGDHAGAVALHERSLAIVQAALGPEHPLIASTLANLGDSERWLGRLDAAMRHHESSLAMREKLLGADHPDLALSLLGLGTDLRVAGRLDEALTRHAAAVAVVEKAHGADHPNLGPLLAERGRTELALQRHDQAATTLKRAIELLDAAEASGRRRGDARLQLARATLPSDRTQALAIARDAREILSTAGPSDDLAAVEKFIAENAAPVD